jgi:hypothetical protein
MPEPDCPVSSTVASRTLSVNSRRLLTAQGGVGFRIGELLVLI